MQARREGGGGQEESRFLASGVSLVEMVGWGGCMRPRRPRLHVLPAYWCHVTMYSVGGFTAALYCTVLHCMLTVAVSQGTGTGTGTRGKGKGKVTKQERDSGPPRPGVSARRAAPRERKDEERVSRNARLLPER